METIISHTIGIASRASGAALAKVYITDSAGQKLEEVAEKIGNANNDFAQFYAVMLALQTLKQMYAEETNDMKFEIRLDSEVVKKQLNAEQPVQDPGSVPMFIEIHNMKVLSFPNISFTLVSKEENEVLAN
jgi:ribonuclease HI